MEILVQVFVLERVGGCLLGRRNRRVEVLQLGAEAHPYLERVRHIQHLFPCAKGVVGGLLVASLSPLELIGRRFAARTNHRTTDCFSCRQIRRFQRQVSAEVGTQKDASYETCWYRVVDIWNSPQQSSPVARTMEAMEWGPGMACILGFCVAGGTMRERGESSLPTPLWD